jgi:hypothetical protein
MTITFESNQNTLSSSDFTFHFKEQEQLKYSVAILPEGQSYRLQIRSESRTNDANRLFLYENLHLEEVTAPGNTFKFTLLKDKHQIGDLYFNYYPDTDYKTFNVCLKVNIFSNIKDVLFVFSQIENFNLTT